MAISANTVTYLPGALSSDGAAAVEAQAGSELASIFAGADVGLALFDANLALLACNSLYRSLCGYLTDEANPFSLPLGKPVRL